MRDLLSDLMDSASRHAEYADVRHIRSLERSLATRNGELDEVETYEEEGIGVRVRVGGAWGFAATHETTPAAAEAALRRAVEGARAQPRGRRRPPSGPPPPPPPLRPTTCAARGEAARSAIRSRCLSRTP